MSNLNQFKFGTKEALKQAILARSPTGYWICDETGGTTLTDYSGNGFTLTKNAGAVTLAAVRLLADDSKYVRMFNNGAYWSRAGTLGITMPLTGSWTCTAMVMMMSVGVGIRILDFSASGESEATNFQFSAVIGATSLMTNFWEGAGSANYSVSNAAPLLNGVPYNVTWVNNSATSRLSTYMNGRKIGVYVNSSPLPSGGSGCSTFLGGDTSNANADTVVGHVAFFNGVAFTDSQVAEIAVAAGRMFR